VRNGHETPARLEPLRRWTTNPRFYVRSADQNGQEDRSPRPQHLPERKIEDPER